MAYFSWLEHRVSNRKVTGSIPYCVLYVVVSLGNTLKANSLTGTFCDVEDLNRTGVCFITAYSREKNLKTSGYGPVGIFESGSG